MDPITQSQKTSLRRIAAKVFPDEEAYYDWLGQNFFNRPEDKRSRTREMYKHEAHQAISLLLHGWDKYNPARDPRNGGSKQKRDHLSVGQADKIAILEILAGWEDGPGRMIGFIHRQTGLNKSAAMLNPVEATKVIIGLQRIIAGGDTALYNSLNSLQTQQYKENGKLNRQAINDLQIDIQRRKHQ